MVKNESKARNLIGKIINNKMQKTVVVEVERSVKHPKYGKIIRRRSKLHVHNENIDVQIGSNVKIQECKPFSKKKSWQLEEIIR